MQDLDHQQNAPLPRHSQVSACGERVAASIHRHTCVHERIYISILNIRSVYVCTCMYTDTLRLRIAAAVYLKLMRRVGPTYNEDIPGSRSCGPWCTLTSKKQPLLPQVLSEGSTRSHVAQTYLGPKTVP